MRTSHLQWQRVIGFSVTLVLILVSTSLTASASNLTYLSVSIPETECQTSSGFFSCNNRTTCIEINKVCDNVSHCSDGSDEGGRCSDNTECEALRCLHQCAVTPSGSMCICDQGWKLENETCVDINECNYYGVCDQRCDNFQGSFACSCDPEYVLQSNNHTCKQIEGGVALLILNSASKAFAYNINLGIIAAIRHSAEEGLIKGVDYDGGYIYWTENRYDFSTIKRVTGSASAESERIVTMGYKYYPEDLAVDWITLNIYFTNYKSSTIGICKSGAKSCKLIKVSYPKFLTLNPSKRRYVVTNDLDPDRRLLMGVSPCKGDSTCLTQCGLYRTMYWTEEEHLLPARVMNAGMDGSNPLPLGLGNIAVMNMLYITFDFHSDRLYWINIAEVSIESVRLDGTQHQIVSRLRNVGVPYGLAVFEDRLYTAFYKEELYLYSGNKFTADNFSELATIRDAVVLEGMRLHHVTVQQKKTDNPCKNASCVGMCMLAPNDMGYSCACDEDSLLNPDNSTCRPAISTDILLVSVGNTLVRIQFNAFRNFSYTHVPLPTLKNIGPITYDSLQGKAILYDTELKNVYSFEPKTNRLDVILSKEIGNITDIDYDYLAGNLYWIDSEKRTIEVMSTKTQRRIVLKRNLRRLPVKILLVPERNALFLATYEDKLYIDRFTLNGVSFERGIKNESYLVEVSSQGPPFSMTYNPNNNWMIWTDGNHIGNVKLEERIFDYYQNTVKEMIKPASDIATLDDHFFWIHRTSKQIHWRLTERVIPVFSFGSKRVIEQSHHFDIGLASSPQQLHMVTVSEKGKSLTHLCHDNNGNCSHICLSSSEKAVCVCPDGVKLHQDGRTCDESPSN